MVYFHHNNSMPNVRARDKKRLNIWVNRELHRRIEIYAELNNMTMSEIIIKHLIELTSKVELTADDYKKIYEEMQKAGK